MKEEFSQITAAAVGLTGFNSNVQNLRIVVFVSVLYVMNVGHNVLPIPDFVSKCPMLSSKVVVFRTSSDHSENAASTASDP